MRWHLIHKRFDLECRQGRMAGGKHVVRNKLPAGYVADVA